jgi:hypothetical protein
MSEREFLELLNLYLDREITPADADRLEREIRADASRHRTYLQYCRMQQAVRLLGTAGDIGSEARTAEVPASRKVVSGDRWSSRWIWTGALAAAALIVLVLGVRRPDLGKAAFENRLAVETAPREAAAKGMQPALGLSGDALLLSAFPATSAAPKVHEDQFNWMRQFQLVSLEARTGAQPLSPATVAPQPLPPAAPGRPHGEDATEMAAFKFVK